MDQDGKGEIIAGAAGFFASAVYVFENAINPNYIPPAKPEDDEPDDIEDVILHPTFVDLNNDYILRIKFYNNHNIHVKVYDVYGNRITDLGNINIRKMIELDLEKENLKAGIYFIHIQGKNTNKKYPFIVVE